MDTYKQNLEYKYSLEKNVLVLKTEHGQYKFKIENADVLENVDQIATTLINELLDVEEKRKADSNNLSYYSRLLLASLNICEKYTKLERKYDQISNALESLKKLKFDLDQLTSSSPILRDKCNSEKKYSAIDSAASFANRETSEVPQETIETKSGLATSFSKPTIAVSHFDECSATSDQGLTSRKTMSSKKSTSTEKAGGDAQKVNSPKSSSQIGKSGGAISFMDLDKFKSPSNSTDSSQLEYKNVTSSRQQQTPSARSLLTTPFDSFGSIDITNSSAKSESSTTAEVANVNAANTTVSTFSTSTTDSSYGAMSISDAGHLGTKTNAFSTETKTDTIMVSKTITVSTISPMTESLPVDYTMLEGDEENKLLPLSTISPASQSHDKSEHSLGQEPIELTTGTLPVRYPQPSHFLEVEPSPAISNEKEPPVFEDDSACSSALSQGTTTTPNIGRTLVVNSLNTQSSDNVQSSLVDGDVESKEYQLPLLSFLSNVSSENVIDQQRLRSDAELLEKKLGYFGIKGEVMGISPGPVITTFEYKPEPGIKISKIVNLADDLALALSAFSIRIVAPIPGKDVMGIEIPNIKKNLVPFIDVVTSPVFSQSKSKLPICLGKDIVGTPVVVELESMPHLLIAGATGTGKSVGLNAMIISILYKASPDEVRFLMIDPKRIELSFYNDIPHLLTPVITDMNKANTALQWMVREMDRRYNLLAHFQVRHIEQFNQKLAASETTQYDENGKELEHIPYIVVIIDELADLMMTASRDIEFSLTRLAQMARAAGIHLILATQRPSVDVLTGIIKANFPTRISFQVSSKTDSRTIIDSNGAETLLGNGDMLFVPPGTARLTRVHGTYLSEDELINITSFIKNQQKPNYIFDVFAEQELDETESNGINDEYDEKYNEALDYVMTTRQTSISGVQRVLRVGYNRAARIIDLMEKNGIVGPSDGAKPRKVLVNNMNMGC